MIGIYGFDEKGRSWETGVEQVDFGAFPEGCDIGAISYLEVLIWTEQIPLNYVRDSFQHVATTGVSFTMVTLGDTKYLSFSTGIYKCINCYQPKLGQ